MTSISNNPKGFDIAVNSWKFVLGDDHEPPPLETTKVDARVTRIVLDARTPIARAAGLFICMFLVHPALI